MPKAKPSQVVLNSEDNSTLSSDILEVPGATPHFRTELAAQLAELVPEAVADGKLDIEILRELLADDVADSNERFGLFWPGKKRALRAAQAPTTATLKPDFAHSKDWDTTQNVFIEGDNLEVLKTLQRHYHNKIKLIYIDPPYNTGKDFVYPDNFKEGLDTYLEWTRQVNEEGKKVSTNSETEGRYHSNWLNMMYPRLKLARNLLTDDGVIFISINDKEQDNLKKLCNEIFGEGNFVGNVTWKSRVKPVNIGDAKYRPQGETEYVLIYQRTTAEGKFQPLLTGGVRSYPYHLGERKYRIATILKSNRGVNHRSTMSFEIDGYRPPEGQRWQAGDEEIRRLNKDGYIEFKDGTPFRRYFEDEEGAEHDPFYCFMDVDWSSTSETGKSELNDLLGNNHGFDTVKPTRLIKTLIQSLTVPDTEEIVLDFFAGSSTTAHAVMALNAEDNGKRRFVMVQLPQPPETEDARKAGFKTIADISRKRIELAGEKIKQGAGLLAQHLDTGFRAYKLADTNFSKWRVTSEVAVNELEQHLLDLRDSADDEAQADDLLTELLLKLGYSLAEPIHTENIAGLEVRKVGDNEVLAYLNEHAKPTLVQLRALVDAAPARIIVLEDAFHGDDELKTNLAQHAKSRGIELWTA